MTLGVGISTAEIELSRLSDMTQGVNPIGKSEHASRVAQAQALMQRYGIDALYINAGTSLLYFTGTSWHATERLVGAIIPAHGDLQYIVPAFEKGTFLSLMQVDGHINCWQEHENPYDLLVNVLANMGLKKATLASMNPPLISSTMA